MRRVAWLRWGVLTFLAWPGSVLASQPGLSLEDVLTAVRERSPELVAAQSTAAATRASRVGATPLFHANPSITGGVGGVVRLDEPLLGGGAGGAGTIQLQVPVEIAGQRWARVAAVDAHVNAQQWTAREVAAQLRAQAAQAFAHALYAQGALELAQHNVALSQRVLQATQDRVAAGAARAVEVELAQLGVDQALQAQAAAAARQQAALVALLGVMGGWNQDVTRVEGTLHTARAVPALDTVLAAARQRPDVEAARAGHGAALQDARLAATEAIPSPTLGAQYQYWNREHAMVGTVTFPLPVFSRGQGEEARARTRAFGYQREADARVQQAQAQARAAHALLTSLAAQRERLQLGPSQALLTRLEDAWRAREVTLDVVLDAQRRVMAARLDALELDLQEALAFVVLDLTMGVQP